MISRPSRTSARAAANAATETLDIVILGLSITSSWGNGHATTYRALVRALHARGHRVQFLERDVPWYAEHRDLPVPPYCRAQLYRGVRELRTRFAEQVRHADVVIVGSYVPDGIEVGEWVTRTAHGVTAFYDIDTPITLAAVARGECAYLEADLIPAYALYLSFTGGPLLDSIVRDYRAARARPLYCSVDAEDYYPESEDLRWDLGYMGTYSDDRQPLLERLLLSAARAAPGARFVVAGPQYPPDLRWPPNVQRLEHLPPAEHRAFYNRQRFTLNITRRDMVHAGWSPSVRLFEAAACGTPIISDRWTGLDSFFVPGEEILLSTSAAETLHYLRETSATERIRIGLRARQRVLATHTAGHRARELERYVHEAAAAAVGVSGAPSGGKWLER